MNESIARQANKEDKCKGRFWEGRFKSQALLDEAALLTCMAYVDLNPIRAKMCNTPEQSKFTSIQERIHAFVNKRGTAKQPKQLKRLSIRTLQDKSRISFKLEDYFQLVDWTGRQLKKGKRGAIPLNYPDILLRLKLDPEKWLNHMQKDQSNISIALGKLSKIKQYAKSRGFKWLRGGQYNLYLFGS